MGLDVALGVIILIAAIRGWLQGFVYQAIRIAGLVGCVYLATPVRDQAKPHVLPYLSSIPPDLVDRIMWWVSAFVSYVVLVGATSLVIKMTRRPEIPGMPPPPRNDQFAGFLMGIAKGALVAAFLTAGIQKYALTPIEKTPLDNSPAAGEIDRRPSMIAMIDSTVQSAMNWVATIPQVDQQLKTSKAIQWNAQFRPAGRIWKSVPVQHFVNHIQRMGLQNPADGPARPDEKPGAHPVVQTASRTPEWELAGAPKTAPDPKTPAEKPAAGPAEADRDEVAKAIEEANAALDAASKRPN
jgi:uncharacterized membrane protein required for colicin V production